MRKFDCQIQDGKPTAEGRARRLKWAACPERRRRSLREADAAGKRQLLPARERQAPEADQGVGKCG